MGPVLLYSLCISRERKLHHKAVNQRAALKVCVTFCALLVITPVCSIYKTTKPEIDIEMFRMTFCQCFWFNRNIFHCSLLKAEPDEEVEEDDNTSAAAESDDDKRVGLHNSLNILRDQEFVFK